MNLKSIGSAIGKIAPLLGGVIGGPLGAGVATIAARALGVGADDEKGLLAAIQNPENAIKIMELEQTHQMELERLKMRETELLLADTQNARGREISITQTTGKRDINLYVLAWVVVAGFFVMTGMLYFKEIPAGSIGPVNQLFGALTLAFGGVIQYFFGSSRGSAEKTAIMAEQAKQKE